MWKVSVAVVGAGVDPAEEQGGARVVLQRGDAAGQHAPEQLARVGVAGLGGVEPVGGLAHPAQLVAGVVEVGLLAGEHVGGGVAVVSAVGAGTADPPLVCGLGSHTGEPMMVAREGPAEVGSGAVPAPAVGGSRETAGMDRSTAPIQVVFDAADPGALAAFWASALAERGYAVPAPPGDFADWPAFLAANGVPEERWNDASAIEADGHPRIFFQKVPEAKTVKNRVHIDLLAGGGPSVPARRAARAGGGGGGAARRPGRDPASRTTPTSACTGRSCATPRATSSASETRQDRGRERRVTAEDAPALHGLVAEQPASGHASETNCSDWRTLSSCRVVAAVGSPSWRASTTMFCPSRSNTQRSTTTGCPRSMSESPPST